MAHLRSPGPQTVEALDRLSPRGGARTDRRRVPAGAGQPVDPQHRSRWRRAELVGRPGSVHGAGPVARPRAREGRTGETGAARRAPLRGQSVRHHGPVHFGLRAGARGGGDRLPQPGTPPGATSRGRHFPGREHHGEARALRIRLPGSGGRVRRGGGRAAAALPRCQDAARYLGGAVGAIRARVAAGGSPARPSTNLSTPARAATCQPWDACWWPRTAACNTITK